MTNTNSPQQAQSQQECVCPFASDHRSNTNNKNDRSHKNDDHHVSLSSSKSECTTSALFDHPNGSTSLQDSHPGTGHGKTTTTTTTTFTRKNGRRQHHHQHKTTTTNTRRWWSISKVRASRILFVVCLMAAAAVFAKTAHHFVLVSERRLATQQFTAVADRALTSAQSIILRQRGGPITMAAMFAQNFARATLWPLQIRQPGFSIVANHVLDMSHGVSMGLLPIVQPGEELRAFEDFCYNDLFPQQYPDEPNVATFSFGRGVYGMDYALDNEDKRYHDVNATTSYGSPNQILTPYLYHSMGSAILMLNLHNVELFGKPMDQVIACSAERQRRYQQQQQQQTTQPSPQSANTTTNTTTTNTNTSETQQDMLLEEEYDDDDDDDDSWSNMECSQLTDILVLKGQNRSVRSRVAGIVVQPVYPAQDPATLVGFVVSTLVWDEALMNVFSNQVNGVDCVLKTESQTYTFEIINGMPMLKGEGDLHDPNFSQYAQSTVLAGPGLFSNTSTLYTVTLYPNNDLFKVYSTDNPTIAIVGSVCIMLITSLLFFLYDSYVRQEFYNKHTILETKRRFVRFVSHEVRTPLNAVCMGLKLLQEEMQRYAQANTTATPSSSLGSSTSTTASSSQPMTQSPEKENDRGGQKRDDHIEKPIAEVIARWTAHGEEVLQNAHSAVNVLTDLLHYDKVESGTLKLELSVVSMFDLLDDVVSAFKLPAQKKQISLKIDPSHLLDSVDPETGWLAQLSNDHKELKVIGDHSRLSQVMRNLVSNGIKFTPENGHIIVRPRWVKPQREQKMEKFILENGEAVYYSKAGFLHIDVIDDGAGMTEEQLQNLFGEGVQFNVNVLQAGQGSGLGLYIAKGLAVQHGGSLTASSGGLGAGSTFTIVLPLHLVPREPFDAAVANDTDVTEKAATDSSVKFDPLRVLVVDDAAMNRKLLVRLLKKEGHECIEAEDGLIAVEKVQESIETNRPFDTILMDYEMPRMNGPTATQAIRALGSDSFVIGITGNLFPEDVAYFKESGANKVLGKPLDFNDLLSTWAEHGIGSTCHFQSPQSSNRQNPYLSGLSS